MEKINSIIEIAQLIARDMRGQLSYTEKEILEKWILSSEANHQLYINILDKENFMSRNSLHESIDTEKGWNHVFNVLNAHQKVRLLPLLFRYAAAIMIPVLIGISVYWFLNGKPQKISQPIAAITHGSNQAVLVLANGKSVNLTNDSTKNLIEKDGTVIKNSNHELMYAEQPSNRGQKPILNTLIVPQGGEYTLVLSDGTRVFVNSMSKLVYPVSFAGDKREISLEGEAYFEVFKDKSKPFIVSTNGLQVEVLGTSFNIKAYPDENQSFTTLVEGKVKLKRGIEFSDESFLTSDQQAIYDHTTASIVVQHVDARQFMQWTEGKYIFTNEPLGEIMKTLSRWYDFNYQFEDASLKKIRFEGGLNKYESIDPIIDIIKKTGKIKVSQKGEEVLFSKI